MHDPAATLAGVAPSAPMAVGPVLGRPGRLAALLLAAAGFLAGPHAALGAVAPRPKLVVVLVVDQMRADYLDRYGHQWTSGLKRLTEQGAWYRQAAYPYFNTVTCAGHATISTGTVPATHGMILNGWWDRQAGAMRTCTDDPEFPIVSYGAPVNAGHSPNRVRVPAFADELRTQTTPAPRVVALSMKPRSAITLAGRRADAVVFAERGGLATSSYYSREKVPWVERFIADNPPSAGEQAWSLRLPASAYLFDDAGLGERPRSPWTSSFPHPFGGPAAPGFLAAWAASPLTDDYLGRMARSAVDTLGLGKGPGIDYLAVGFSALDGVGHAFGPRSHEVQDTLVRLDATIGALLDHLDRAVGRDAYVVALSADHGVSSIPEQAAADGLEAGRIVLEELARRVDEALRPAGIDKAVAQAVYTELYFLPGVYERVAADAGLLRRAADALLSVPGVSRVLRGEELARSAAAQDPITRSAALSYDPERSGDLVVLPRPYWIHVHEGSGPAATHGTGYGYDTRVPVVLMGPGIHPGHYLEAATPGDIAPTLAFLTGITLARADGRVLTEALLPATAVTAAPKPVRPRPAS